MPSAKINANRPDLWKADVAASVDEFNRWFMNFAPEAFRSTRAKTTGRVKDAFLDTNDLRNITSDLLKTHPSALSTLRMCTAPPLAVDRLVGLAGVNKSLVTGMDVGKLSLRMSTEALQQELASIANVISKLLDRDIFPWLESESSPTEHERDRAATVIADRLCSAVANPIVRNAQEKRQLAMVGQYLEEKGYVKQAPLPGVPLSAMRPGTYAFRVNITVGKLLKVTMPIDVIVQPHKPRRKRLPILIEAKSAGDFTNTNKRRKEEATKIRQLQETFGEDVIFVLFLCGYFGSDYLGYEAAEGIDWVWEHRIEDFAKLGL